MGKGISELFRRAESAPSEPEACAHQLEQVLEQIGEAVIVKDLDAIVTYWNREAVSLYGFTQEEAIGQSLRKLHAADLSEADYMRVIERVRAGKPTSSTTERRKRSGETVRVVIKTTPLVDARGRLVGEITVARDVTQMLKAVAERKSAEIERRRSEAQFAALFNQAATGMAQTDMSGTFLRVNEKLCTVLGYSAGELLGLRFHEVTHSGDLARSDDLLRKLAAGAVGAYTHEKRYVRKDGTPISVSVSRRPQWR